MSTVGYGDVTCTTDIGKLFIMVFIIGSIYLFARNIDVIVQIVGKTGMYSGQYRKPAGVGHIVIVGSLTYYSVKNFVSEFFLKDWQSRNITLIFLDREKPDLRTNALFKKYFTNVKFFIGTPMNSNDLERVKLKEADAFLALANPQAVDRDEEDASNILRVIAAKNFHPEIRVIVQLLSYENKAYLINLAPWNEYDQIICEDEVKLGFLAQSCLAPGFSTLIANLFVLKKSKKQRSNHVKEKSNWRSSYITGSNMEMWTSEFSESFHGCTFLEAINICYTHLDLLLIGIKAPNSYGQKGIIMNASSKYTIDENTKGIFICHSGDYLRSLLNFCKKCHNQSNDKGNETKCSCKSKERVRSHSSHISPNPRHSQTNKKILSKQKRIEVSAISDVCDDDIPSDIYDFTGLFHWCEEVPFEKALWKRSNLNFRDIKGHIVVCVFGGNDSNTIGLCNFVMPLRNSTFLRKDLKSIVFVGDENFLRKEWATLKNFPKLYVKPGSPLHRSNLRAIKVNSCSMCVILKTDKTVEDMILADKETIICTLGIKSMKFYKWADLWKTKGNDLHMTGIRESIASLESTQTNESDISEDIDSNDTDLETKLTRIFILERFKSTEDKKDIQNKKSIHQLEFSGSHIPLITDLEYDSNVRFLDLDNFQDPNLPFRLSLPFACGSVFTSSLLDSLICATYFNPDAMNIIKILLTGAVKPELDQMMAEGIGIVKGADNIPLQSTRNRCRVNQIAMTEALLYSFIGQTYEKMFCSLLNNKFIICLGLYRKLNILDKCGSYERFVITNPPKSLTLHPNDLVYCLVPFEKSNDSFDFDTSEETVS